VLLKHLWIILIFLRPDATSSQQIKSGLSLILGRNSYELNEPVPLEGLTSDLWIHNRSQYEWEYGIVIQVDNLTGIKQNWKRMYEGYLKKRFGTKN